MFEKFLVWATGKLEDIRPGSPARAAGAGGGGQQEKRKSPRVDAVDIRFKVLDPDYHTSMLEKAELKNISKEGCGFLSERNVPEKAHLLLVLGLPLDLNTAKIEVVAEAVRMRKLPDGLFEIGVVFLETSGTKTEQLLVQYVASFGKGA